MGVADGVVGCVCVVLILRGWVCGLPSVGRGGSVCNHFPAPVHTVRHASAVVHHSKNTYQCNDYRQQRE